MDLIQVYKKVKKKLVGNKAKMYIIFYFIFIDPLLW